MPLYEYQCDACGKRFEIIQKFSDSPAESCRHCGGSPVQRLVSSPAIQFKGTGWYITDYSQKGKPAEGSSDKAKEGGDKGKEGGGGDDKAKDAGTKSTSTSDTSSGAGDSAAKPAAAAAGSSKAS